MKYLFSILKISPQHPLYKDSLQLRNDILRKPLGLDVANEDLSEENLHVHFVALQNEMVVGCVVLIPNVKPKVGKLRQMATAENVRGKGFGIALVKALETYAKKQGMECILLNARHYAVGFYEKLGYAICSAAFEEVGIEHYQMTKKLV